MLPQTRQLYKLSFLFNVLALIWHGIPLSWWWFIIRPDNTRYDNTVSREAQCLAWLVVSEIWNIRQIRLIVSTRYWVEFRLTNLRTSHIMITVGHSTLKTVQYLLVGFSDVFELFLFPVRCVMWVLCSRLPTIRLNIFPYYCYWACRKRGGGWG